MQMTRDPQDRPFEDGRDGAHRTAGKSAGYWAFVVMPAAMLAVLLLRPSSNSDLFWQLKLGELTLAHRGPVWSEPFAISHLGEPLQNLAWAGQALFAAVREWAGWRGLRLFDAVCWAGGFWLVAAACRRRGDAPLRIAAGLLLGFVAALPTAIMRPQNLASVCFGLLLVLLKARIGARTKFVLGCLLLVAWQNLHPSVSVGFGVLGLAAAMGWFEWWRGRSLDRPWVETLLVPVAALAMVCTPDGTSILAISALNAQLSVMVGVGEWMPLWAPLNRGVAMPILAVAAVTVLAVRRNVRRIDLRDAAIAIALFAMTLIVYRFVLFWAIALVPVVARGMDRSGPDGEMPRRTRSIWLAAASIVVTGLAITAARPVEFRKHIPLAALERLRQERLSGTVFTDFTLGGTVLHVGYPAWRVTYDGRYYRYTRAEWERFARIQSGEVGLDALDARYRPVAWVLQPEREAKLIMELGARPERWRRLWADRAVAIFVPVNRPAPAN